MEPWIALLHTCLFRLGIKLSCCAWALMLACLAMWHLALQENILRLIALLTNPVDKACRYSSNGLSWPEKSVPLDGVNELSIMNANFSTVISDIQTILNLCSCRGSTLLEKITSLVIPKIIHNASHLPETSKKIIQVMFKFIWRSKWEKKLEELFYVTISAKE